MKKIHNKLVRDKIPEICRTNGAEPETRILNEEEYKVGVRQKLGEEAAEYVRDDNLEELADILELVKANAEVKGGTMEEVEKIRAKKAKERGGFSQKIFLISTTDKN